jgi:hypothetical protein
MTITIPLIGIILLIVGIHTILQHLLAWLVRETIDSNDTGMLGILLFLAEIVVCTLLLCYYVP